MTNKNVSIAIVGKDHAFTVYDDAGVDPYLAGIEGEERRFAKNLKTGKLKNSFQGSKSSRRG